MIAYITFYNDGRLVRFPTHHVLRCKDDAIDLLYLGRVEDGDYMMIVEVPSHSRRFVFPEVTVTQYGVLVHVNILHPQRSNAVGLFSNGIEVLDKEGL